MIRKSKLIWITFIIEFVSIEFQQSLAQCNPPPAETCEEASVFCSLDALNGYSCNNPSKTRSALRPACAFCCPPGLNRTWWAFVSQGGNATLTLNIGSCDLGLPGLVLGVWGDCDCTEEIDCMPNCLAPNTSKTYQLANLKPCKIYYISIDACRDVICDFTFNTSGGKPPTLSPIGYINGITSGIIEPVCVGACNYKFFVTAVQGSCQESITYIWTLDGLEVGANSNEIRLDFPKEGDFTLCVTAYIGNPNSGSVCAQQGPRCTTVKVRPYADRTGMTRTLCFEQANPIPYKWHSQNISITDIYYQNFIDNNCCSYDSIVAFTILPASIPIDFFYLTCDSIPFADGLGVKYPICTNHLLVNFPKVTERYKCDSSIFLTSVSIGLNANWNAQCLGTKVEISPNISIVDTCSIRTTQKLDYKWYKKADTTKTSISKIEKLIADTINDDYCLEISVTAILGKDTAYCTKTLCEIINESEAGAIIQNKVLSFCDSAVINGQTYTQSDTVTQKLKTASGCDSIINTIISIQKSSQQSFSFSSCDSVVFNGKIYKVSGDYTEKYQSANGCDSIFNIHVNIPNSKATPYAFASCDSALINNTLYTQSGKYTQLLKSANGCDSTLSIDLTISKSNAANFSFTSCDSAIINTQKYFQSGNYTQLLQNTNQCDSTLSINLTITKSTSGDTLFRSCDSVIINGQTYRQTGIYQQTLINSNQCDSILIIDFTRLSKSSTNINYQSCDSITVNGQVFKQSGIYTQTFVNANQCDSVVSLDVIITKSNSFNYTLSACDSVDINEKIYKQTGKYQQALTNAAQCDSLLNVDLTIYPGTSTNYISKSCDSVIINGQVYNQSGAYRQDLKSAHLCDSTLFIQFTLLDKTSSNIIQTACDSIVINGIKYSISGSYIQTLINNSGCDSILTLDLTIKPGNPSTLDAGIDTSICDGEIIKLNGLFSGSANFLWHSTSGSFDNPNNLSTNFYPTVIGNERLYLQASDDCKQWLDSIAINVIPKQIVLVTGDSIINPCKEITFTASGGTNYIWTPASLIECLDPACKTVRLKSNSTERFTITTDGPCVIPANLNLSLLQVQSEIYLPNVFSPNGDNINDFFFPVFNCDQVNYYNLQIFDRWGNLIFESNIKDKGWNGKYKDENMNPGVYPYVVQYELHGGERKVMAGDVTLVR